MLYDLFSNFRLSMFREADLSDERQWTLQSRDIDTGKVTFSIIGRVLQDEAGRWGRSPRKKDPGTKGTE
jgi:hypothetical protein